MILRYDVDKVSLSAGLYIKTRLNFKEEIMVRLSKPHFRQGIIALLDGDLEKEEKALLLIDAYSKTKKQDVDKLLNVIKELVGIENCRLNDAHECLTHKADTRGGVCPHHRAKHLLEEFDGNLGSKLIFSQSATQGE